MQFFPLCVCLKFLIIKGFFKAWFLVFCMIKKLQEKKAGLFSGKWQFSRKDEIYKKITPAQSRDF